MALTDNNSDKIMQIIVILSHNQHFFQYAYIWAGHSTAKVYKQTQIYLFLSDFGKSQHLKVIFLVFFPSSHFSVKSHAGFKHVNLDFRSILDVYIYRGLECKPPHFLIRATFFTLSHPSHIKMLVLHIFFYKFAFFCRFKTF